MITCDATLSVTTAHQFPLNFAFGVEGSFNITKTKGAVHQRRCPHSSFAAVNLNIRDNG